MGSWVLLLPPIRKSRRVRKKEAEEWRGSSSKTGALSFCWRRHKHSLRERETVNGFSCMCVYVGYIYGIVTTRLRRQCWKTLVFVLCHGPAVFHGLFGKSFFLLFFPPFYFYPILRNTRPWASSSSSSSWQWHKIFITATSFSNPPGPMLKQISHRSE